MENFRVAQAGQGLWVIYSEGINLYLIAGQTRAVLLDSGFGDFENLRERAQELCGMSVELVHTHAHGDHTGGDGAWDRAWMHPGELENYRREWQDSDRQLLPLADGDVIDLGGRTLEVIHVPGHSPGSVALLDRENRLLFSGDTVMTQPVFLMFPNASASDYLASLEKLAARGAEYDLVYPCHQKWPLEPKGAIAALQDCARQAMEGRPDTLVRFKMDLGVAVAEFEGYEKDGYAVCVKELGGLSAPVK